MDLSKLERVADAFQMYSPEDKEKNWQRALYVKGYLKQELPTLHDDQLAAVADYISILLAALYNKPFNQAADDIYITTVAYGIAAADLVGLVSHGKPQNEPGAPGGEPEGILEGLAPETPSLFQPFPRSGA